MTFEVIATGETKPDFVSCRIEKAIQCNYSHVAILVNGTTVYHATGKGFHKEPLENLLENGKRVIRRRFYVPVSKECCALTWLEARIGLRYSNLQYLGFIFPFLRFLPFVNNGRAEVVCSEIVADFVSENTTHGTLFRWITEDSDFVDPRLCIDTVEKIYGQSIYGN